MSTDEPTLPERRQAEVLARWLEGATDGIPEDLDTDVIEAVLALRPELAPEPGLSAEDILGEVAAGPLAVPDLQAVTAEGSAPDRPAAGASLGQLAPRPEPANRARGMGWAITAVGGLAAVAAAALLFFVTNTSLQSPGSMARLEERESAPVADRAPAAAPADVAPESADAEKPNASGADEIDVPLDAPSPAPDADQRMARADDLQQDKSLDELKDLDGDAAGALGRGGLEREAGSSSAYRPAANAAPEEDPGDAVAMEDEELEDLMDAERVEVESDELAVTGGAVTSETLDSAPRQIQSLGTASRSSGRDGPRRKRSRNKAEESAPAAPAASAEPSVDLDSLERRARPSSPPAAETQAIIDLLDAGKARDARDSARSLLTGSSLSALRRADLQWALGRAHLALGERSAAETAFREAVRLRGG